MAPPSPSNPSRPGDLAQRREYSAAEQEHYRSVFAPVAAEYRRWSRLSVGQKIWLGSLVASLFLGLLFLPKSAGGWLGVPALLLLATLFYIIYQTPNLTCPACGGELGYGHGDFCLQCGSADVDSGTDFRPMFCRACAMSLRSDKRKGRKYRIHACPHCGLWLDDQGL